MKNLILQPKSSTEPFLQQVIRSGYDIPYTMNPTIGCFYGCSYCFTPVIQHKTFQEFSETVKVKGNFPEKIDKRLTQLNNLPQHFKRVQINESADIYHPKVFHGMRKEYGRDLMAEIYTVSKKHWDNGNKWMLHILTKSHLITEHIEILKDIREMVQVEISICSPDEAIIRKYEKETPSLKRRLETIEKLSKEGIFVRVMAMPYLGTKDDAIKLRDLCFNVGAQGFKHKGLNYFTLEDNLQPTYVRNDEIWDEMIVKSGEFVEGSVNILWSDNQLRNVNLVDCGYTGLNNVDWGYVV